MDAIEFLAALRASRTQPGYFSVEAKVERRSHVKRKHAKVKGEPVAGTGKWKYRMPKHYDCECPKCAPKPRTTQRREALRDQEN